MFLFLLNAVYPMLMTCLLQFQFLVLLSSQNYYADLQIEHGRHRYEILLYQLDQIFSYLLIQKFTLIFHFMGFLEFVLER